MTTKVTIHNEGPNSIVIDDGQPQFQVVIPPFEGVTELVYKGRTLTIFELDDDAESSI